MNVSMQASRMAVKPISQSMRTSAPLVAPRARTPAPTSRRINAAREVSTPRWMTNAVKADQAGAVADSGPVQLIADITKLSDEQLASIIRENLDLASRPQEPPSSELRSKVEEGIRRLSKGLLERDTEVRLLLLASLCGEHLLLLGPPGTAKSELSRRLHGLLGGQYFERLLTRFSVPEELFGPLSMKGLENDLYVRKIDGYLPVAEVAFVDEIFKANSAILNALLTLLNERLFDNGNERLEAPLLTLVGASNELPESEELDALYDRFLVRRTVAQVSNNQLYKLARLASGRGLPKDDKDKGADEAEAANRPAVTIEDIKTCADIACDSVDVPDNVIDLLTTTRNYLQDKAEPPIYVSDRRFMKAVQYLQVVAHGDGRSEVTEFDCLLLEHVFGNRPDDSHKVRAFILETIASDPGLQQTELVFLGVFGRACRLLESDPKSAEAAECLEEARSLADLLKARQADSSMALDGNFPELRNTIWQSETSVQGAVQALTPQMTENKRKTEELLREALILRECLERGTSASVLERLLPKRYKQYQKGVSGKA